MLAANAVAGIGWRRAGAGISKADFTSFNLLPALRPL
jgi:hypothetical protein